MQCWCKCTGKLKHNGPRLAAMKGIMTNEVIAKILGSCGRYNVGVNLPGT